MQLLIPDWAAPGNVAALTTLREGGFSAAPYGDGQGGGGLNLGTHVDDDPPWWRAIVRCCSACCRLSRPG
jgi:copper oxidase (laccase) domain-containing protein